MSLVEQDTIDCEYIGYLKFISKFKKKLDFSPSFYATYSADNTIHENIKKHPQK